MTRDVEIPGRFPCKSAGDLGLPATASASNGKKDFHTMYWAGNSDRDMVSREYSWGLSLVGDLRF